MYTSREKEVLELICKGYSNPEIATELFISRHTVKAHVAFLLRKFGVKNRTNAVSYAIKHGLVEI